jgi:hypothetical protein
MCVGGLDRKVSSHVCVLGGIDFSSISTILELFQVFILLMNKIVCKTVLGQSLDLICFINTSLNIVKVTDVLFT